MPTSDIKKGPLYVDSTNNSVGIGTTTNNQSSSAASVTLNAASGMSAYELRNADVFSGYVGNTGTNMYLVNAKNGSLGLYTNNTERMHLTAAGNVGIGTSPSELLHIKNASGDAAVRIQGNTRTFNIQQNNYGLRFVDVDAGSVERLRIDASGNVLVGKTAGSNTTKGSTLTQTGEIVSTITTAGGASQNIFLNRQDADGTAILFRRANGTVGSISVNSSSTAYNTSSDYRLKTAVEYDWDATTRLKQLNPVRFNFIADADTTVDGFLAHEVQDIVPEAITGTKDAMRDEEYEVTPAELDEDGNEITPAVMGTRSVPDYQGIDQSKLVPLLCKTILELEARITALEAN